MTMLEAAALHTYYHTCGQDLSDSYQPTIFWWARLQLPTRQVARSAWKECRKALSSVRMAWNVKVRLCHAFNFIALLIIIQINIPGKREELAEVQYYFQMIVNA